MAAELCRFRVGDRVRHKLMRTDRPGVVTEVGPLLKNLEFMLKIRGFLNDPHENMQVMEGNIEHDVLLLP